MAQAMPLVLGRSTWTARPAVLENLVRAICAGGNRVTAGDVGFTYLSAPSDADRGDVLYDIVCQPTARATPTSSAKARRRSRKPGTPIQTASQNHCMLGHAEEWFFRGLGGIVPDAAGPGFKRFALMPQLPEGLTWVKADYNSVHGRIASHWRIDGGRLLWQIVVPPNTTAVVRVPAKDSAPVTESGLPADQAEGVRLVTRGKTAAVYEARSGSYQFSAPIGR